MNLTTFQRLVLLALASLVKDRKLKAVMRRIALGHHTDGQATSLFEEWRPRI